MKAYVIELQEENDRLKGRLTLLREVLQRMVEISEAMSCTDPECYVCSATADARKALEATR